MRILVQRLDLFLEEAAAEKFVDYKSINLVQEYTRLNRTLFDGKLGVYPMKWNRRKNSAGVTKAKQFPDGKVILTGVEMSTFFVNTYQGFLNILAHEMIHVYLLEQQDAFSIKDSNRHGVLFQSEMKRINGMGKGFNIQIREDRTHDKVAHKGKKKRYGVLLIDGANGESIVVFSDKALPGVFDEMLTYPQGWLVKYKMWFVYSMEDFLARYPVKRKIGKRFGAYEIDKKEWEKVYKTGIPYAEIINNTAGKAA